MDYIQAQDSLTQALAVIVVLLLALVWAIVRRGDITFIRVNETEMITMCWLAGFAALCFCVNTCSDMTQARHKIDVENRVVQTCTRGTHSVCVEDSE